MKIMIIDDETLVRIGLESMLDWSLLGFELCPFATNGKDGFEKISKHAPDLVITDIKMPIMNGIDLIKKCLDNHMKTRFIVLSSYDELEMVKQAMKLGAIDYLLKLEIEKDSLTKVLMQAKELISNENHKNSASELLNNVNNAKLFKSDFLRRYMIGAITLTSSEFKENAIKLQLEEKCTYVLVYFKTYDYPQFKENLTNNNPQYIIHTINELISFDERNLTIIISETEFSLYINISPDNTQYIEELTNKLLNRMNEFFNKKALIGVSQLFNSIVELPIAFSQSMEATKQIITNKSKPIYVYDPELMQNTNHNELKIDFIWLEKDLKLALELEDEMKLKEVFSHIYENLKQIGLRKKVYEYCFKLVYIFTISCVAWDQNIKHELEWDCTLLDNIETLLTIDEIVCWLESIEACFFKYANKNSFDMVNLKVKKIKQLISNNPYDKFSLTQLAERLDITPGYLSTIYKKIEGKSLFDYIAEIKINEAKKLLEMRNYKIYEVSSMLGYDDPYYFSKVFKKITSLTPSEYILKTNAIAYNEK